MDEKIVITKIMKDEKDYTKEELEANRVLLLGFEYDGVVYKFSKPTPEYNDIQKLFSFIEKNGTDKLSPVIVDCYNEYYSAFSKINIDYQSKGEVLDDSIFKKLRNNNIVFENKYMSDIKEKEKEITPIKNLKASKRCRNLLVAGGVALALIGGVIFGKNFDKIVSKFRNISEEDLSTDEVKKATEKFTNDFNKLCEEKANSKNLKLQVTEEETRLFYLFVNYKNFTEEQIANAFGEITEPSQVSKKVTNFVTQINKYEGLTNEKVNVESLIYNAKDKTNYNQFKELIEKGNISKAFSIYAKNNMTYLDYVNPTYYSKLGNKEKETLSNVYGNSLDEFEEYIRRVNALAQINNLVSKFNSDTLSKEDLELRNNPISKGNDKTYKDLQESHGIEKVTTGKTEEITREDAIKDFGSDKVNEAEQKADNTLNNKNEKEEEKKEEIENNYNQNVGPTIDEIIKNGVNSEGLYDIPENANPLVKKELESMNEQLRKAQEQAKKENEQYLNDALKTNVENNNSEVVKPKDENKQPNLDYDNAVITDEYISQDEYEKWLKEANDDLNSVLEETGTSRSR